MKRLLIVVTVLILAVSAFGRNDHIRPYTEGVAAVEAEDWVTVAAKMEEAIAHESKENKSLRTRSGYIPYLPHFWLGIARANQEKWDVALRELEISEKQGVVQTTKYYASLRSTKSKIEGRNASNRSSASVGEARNKADAALNRALSAQADATTLGASRLDEFRKASQKLQEAMASRREGTAEAFGKAAASASEAAELFSRAAARASAQAVETKVQRRPAAPPAATLPAPVPRSAPEELEPKKSNAGSAREEMNQAVTVDHLDGATAAEPLDEAAVAEPVKATVSATKDLPITPQASPSPVQKRVPPDTRIVLASAYRAMASGELQSSASMLSSVIIADPESVDALVLRGYVRFLQAVLQREDKVLSAAADDFRAALRIKPGLRLDEWDFSPKAIRFFEDLKRSAN